MKRDSQTEDPLPLVRMSFGLTRTLPNDALVLENESLSPQLRNVIDRILSCKPVSQAFVPDVIGGVLLSQLLDVPPLPLSMHFAFGINRLIDASYSHSKGEQRNSIEQAVIGAILTLKLTVFTRELISLGIRTAQIIDSAAKGEDRWKVIDHRGKYEEHKASSTLRSLFPYSEETKLTKVELAATYKRLVQSNEMISTSLVDQRILSDYNRVQLDDRGRLVLSKHPFSIRSTGAGFLKKLHRIISWYNPFRRASFQASPVVVRGEVKIKSKNRRTVSVSSPLG